jgi:predicted AAA+ superfamily ATPase
LIESNNLKNANILLKDYIYTISNYDSKEKSFFSPERIIALINSISRNVSCQISDTTLINESKIINTAITLQKYLDFLERMFLIEYLPV